MRTLWPSLRATLARSIDTIEFRRSFEIMRQSRTALRRFDDTTSLLDFLHARSGDFDEKDRILADLIKLAKQNDTTSNAAMTFLWLAFWPGLDAIYRRMWRHFKNQPEELTSEIADYFVSTVKRFEHASVRRVAATILRNVERDICDGLRRERERSRRQVEIPVDELIDHHASCVRGSHFGLPPGVEPDAAISLLRKRLVTAIGEDADLVVLISILGERQRDAAARVALAPEAARKRYQRACARLRSHLAA